MQLLHLSLLAWGSPLVFSSTFPPSIPLGPFSRVGNATPGLNMGKLRLRQL